MTKAVAFILLLQLILPVNLVQLIPQTEAAGEDIYTKLLIHSDTTNGSIVFTDSSRQGYPLTVFGDTKHSTTQKKFGNSALYFDGTGDYLSVPDSEDWNFGTGDFTVDMWVYPTVLNGTSRALFRTSDNINQSVTLGLNTSNQWIWQVGNGACSSYWSSSSDVAVVNTWNHLALIREGNRINFYLNGVYKNQSGDLAGALVCNPSSVLMLGQKTNGTDSFAGYMDEVRVTKGLARWTGNFTPPTSSYADTPRQPSLTLTPDTSNNKIDVDILGAGDEGAMYPNSTIQLDETGLVGHWKMDGDFTDGSGYGNNGTAAGGVSAVAGGQRRQAGSFDGVDDRVQIAHNAILKPSNTISISAWVKPDVGSLNALREIYRKEDTDRHLLSFQST